MKSQIIKIFFSVLIVLSLLTTISAITSKVGIKECLLSLDDLNFGNWNEGQQTGVFMKINNSGTLDDAIYSYYSYTPKRGYSDNFGSYNPSGAWPYNSNSTLPMIKINSSKADIVYAKCILKVGNYRVYPDYFYAEGGGEYNGVMITSDFNLTKNIMTTKIRSINNFLVSGINSPYSIANYSKANFKLKTFWIENDNFMSYLNNTVETPTYDNYNFTKNGFYPNTEPTVIISGNLKDYNLPSGIARLMFRMIENSQQVIDANYTNTRLEKGTFYFYINSTLADSKDYLRPAQELYGEDRAFVKDLNTTKKPYFNMTSGHKINFKFNVSNPFAIKINFSYYMDFDSAVLSDSSNIGALGTNVSNLEYLSPNRLGIELKSGNSMILEENYTIPVFTSQNPYSFSRVRIYSWPSIFDSNNIGATTYTNEQYVGADTEDYLGIESVDPQIGLIGGIANIIIRTELGLPSLLSYRSKIFPDDYYLRVDLFTNYNSPETSIIKTKNFSLDANTFSQLGVSYLTNGNTYLVNINIPISEIGYSGQEIYARVFTVMNKTSSRFYGGKMAGINNYASFKSGEIFFGEGNFSISSTSKQAEKTVMLFNPSFSKYNVTLNYTQVSDNQNFTICFKLGSSCVSLFKAEFNPLETKNVVVVLNGTYNPWPIAKLNGNLTLEATTDNPNSNPNKKSQLLGITINSGCEVENNCISGGTEIVLGSCWVNSTDPELKVYQCVAEDNLTLSPTCACEGSPPNVYCTQLNHVNNGSGFCLLRSCPSIPNWPACLSDTPLATNCTWNYNALTESSAPPGVISEGICTECSSYSACGNYNNNESCLKDKCGLNNSAASELTRPRCSWNSLNTCVMISDNCDITEELIGDCSQDPAPLFFTINTTYTPISGGTCPQSTMINYPCQDNAENLPFFSILHLIIAGLLISLIYFYNSKFKKK